MYQYGLLSDEHGWFIFVLFYEKGLEKILVLESESLKN